MISLQLCRWITNESLLFPRSGSILSKYLVCCCLINLEMRLSICCIWTVDRGYNFSLNLYLLTLWRRATFSEQNYLVSISQQCKATFNLVFVTEISCVLAGPSLVDAQVPSSGSMSLPLQLDAGFNLVTCDYHTLPVVLSLPFNRSPVEIRNVSMSGSVWGVSIQLTWLCLILKLDTFRVLQQLVAATCSYFLRKDAQKYNF